MGRANRRVISQETWDKLVESYRQYPGDHSRARKHADVAYNTARKAWEGGKRRDPNRPPIKEMVARENVQLQEQLADLRRDTVADRKIKDIQAKDNVLDGKTMEQSILTSARANAKGLLGLSGRLVRKAFRLLAFVDEQLDDPSWKPDAAEAINLIGKIVRLAHTANEAAGVTTRMQKDIDGAPEVLVQVAQMSPEMALEAVESADRTRRRLLARMAENNGLSPDVASVVDTTVISQDGTVDVTQVQDEADAAHEAALDTSLLGDDGTIDLDKVEQAMDDLESEVPAPTMLPPPTARRVLIKPSSNIAEAVYDPDALALWITFHSGNTYRYTEVPVETVDAWERAVSSGKFFAAAIKRSDFPVIKIG